MFLKRRALMARAQFNYKIANGIGSLVLKNCKKSLFKRFEIHGKSTQVTTKGINLIPFKVGETIQSSNKGNLAVFGKDGVNVTVNNINPIKESDLYFFGNDNLSVEGGYSDTLQAGKYTFLSNSKLCVFYVVVWRNGTSEILVEGSSKQITHFTILDGDKVRLMLRPKGNVNLKGTEKTQVMLCKHTETNLPYEPYTGGKPSPSPEYPQNTYSTGKKGKNLFDISKLKSSMIPTENINIEESTITLPVGGAIYFNKLKDVCTDLKVGDEAYLFVKSTGTRAFVGFHNETISISSWSFNTKRTVTESMLDSALLLYSDTDKSVVISDIMITKVNDKTYEPYLDKFLVDVSVTGKNLFDINSFPYKQDDETIVINSNEAYGGALLVKGDTLRRKQYVISIESFENIGDNTSTVLLETVYKDGVKDERYLTAMPKKGWVLSSTREIDYIWIRNPLKAGSKIKKLQIEEGKEATEYEPYHEPQTIQLELNEPLRGIGQYKDIVTKKGVLRNILEANISDNLQNVIYGSQGAKYIFSSIKNADLRYDRTRCMSNVGFASNQNRIEYTPIPYTSDFLIQVADDDTVETVKEKTKNITVAYVTKTPIFEPFPPEIQTKLSSLYTNEGTTVVTIDGGEVQPDIEVEYAAEKEKLAYIQSTGTQVIDTLYKPRTNTILEMDIQFVENENTMNSNNVKGNGNSFFGVAFLDNLFAANFGESNTQYNQIFYWNNIPNGPGSIIYSQLYYNITDRSVMLIQNNKVDFLGITRELAPKTTNQDGNMFLFGLNNIRKGTTNYFKRYDMKLYGCKIYEDEVLIKDFVPAKLGNKIGLYDNVSKKFHENKGTGEFLYETEVIE